MNTVDICLTVDAKDDEDMQPFHRSDAEKNCKEPVEVNISSENMPRG